MGDVSNITVISTFNSGVDPQSMAHNGIIKDNYVYIPYYHDGIRTFDISNPNNPIQNYEDTYLPLDHNSHKGAWDSSSFRNIIVSDMQTGLTLELMEITQFRTKPINLSLSKSITTKNYNQ